MKKIISILALASLFTACKKKDVNTIATDGIGLNESVFVDTFSVKTSVVLDDYKTTTENLTYHSVGSYNDQYFGSSSSKAFFKFEDKNQFVAEDIVDSAFIQFNYSFFVQGDTTKTLELELYETTEVLVDDSSYTHHSNLGIGASPIGTLSFKPIPESKGLVKFRLSDAWVATYKQKDIDNAFVGKALCIKAKDGADASIISFEESTLDLVVYGVNNTVAFTKTIDLSTAHDFDSYTFDRTSTGISSLITRGDVVSSIDNNDRTLVQSGSGISTKIELASLKQFLKDNPTIEIDKAELTFFVDEATTGGINAVVPDAVKLYKGNNNVRLRNVDNNLDGGILPDDVVFGGSSTVFYVYNESNLKYTLPITAHLRSVLSNKEELTDLVLFAQYGLNDANANGIFSPSLGDVFQITHSAVLYNENAVADKKPKLEIYYTVGK